VRRLNWRCTRSHRVDIGRHVKSATAECGVYFASTYLRRDGEWSWGAGIVDNLAVTEDGTRNAAVVTQWGGFAPTRRRAQRAARKALARMGLR